MVCWSRVSGYAELAELAELAAVVQQRRLATGPRVEHEPYHDVVVGQRGDLPDGALGVRHDVPGEHRSAEAPGTPQGDVGELVRSLAREMPAQPLTIGTQH